MIRFGIAAWLLLLATYGVLAGQVSEGELIASIPASLIAAVFAVALGRHAQRSFSAPRNMAQFILLSAVQIVPDLFMVGWTLLRVTVAGPSATRGAIVEQPFRYGSSSPRDAMRRAVTTLGVSLAPNGYVLRVFAADEDLLVHRLVLGKISNNREWPA